MILVAGIPSESSVAAVVAALERLRAPVVLFNQRDALRCAVRLRADGSLVTGTLVLPGARIELERVSGVYLRLMDDRWLPEVARAPLDSPARRQARAFHDQLGQWADVAPARVINRYAAMGSNGSKPYQAQLISAHGLRVPPTLVTNDPAAVRAFAAEHGTLIYKSVSSERSIVGTLDPADAERLERIRWCPVQFQALIRGRDVRVHTVGAAVFATAVETDAIDYRYAHRQTGRAATFAPVTLTPALTAQCVTLAAALGLEMAGIDLKFTSDGSVFCFEVNPSPVFSYFEEQTGQPIAAAVARHLAGADPPQPPL